MGTRLHRRTVDARAIPVWAKERDEPRPNVFRGQMTDLDVSATSHGRRKSREDEALVLHGGRRKPSGPHIEILDHGFTQQHRRQVPSYGVSVSGGSTGWARVPQDRYAALAPTSVGRAARVGVTHQSRPASVRPAIEVVDV